MNIWSTTTRLILKFKDTTEHGTTMSLYDYGCKFMHQETASLKAKQEFFFEHFNRDEDAI